MLPKTSVLILGIIDERPLNPYEITKLLDYIHIKDWFPVATSSVYATIKTLHHKGYILGESKKEGNMPEKTIYSITKIGKEELYANLIAYLGSTDLDAVKFNIAGIMLCHIDQGEALKTLTNRLIHLESSSKGIINQLNYLKSDQLVPALGLTVVKHNLYLIEAEIKTTKELITEVTSNTSWNDFLAKQITI